MVGPEPTNWRARFLYQTRLNRPPPEGKKKLTQAEFADELVRNGISLGADPRVRYNRLEKGRDEASDELLAAIAKLYDVPAPEPPEAEPPADLAALIRSQQALTDALDRQTDALAKVVQELRNLSQERAGEASASTEALGGLTRLLAVLEPRLVGRGAQPSHDDQGNHPTAGRK